MENPDAVASPPPDYAAATKSPGGENFTFNTEF